MFEKEELNKKLAKIEEIENQIQNLKREKRLARNAVTRKQKEIREKRLIQIGEEFERLFGERSTIEQTNSYLLRLKKLDSNQTKGSE